TIDFKIIGLAEIVFNHAVNNNPEVFPVHCALPHNVGIIGKLMNIPVIAAHIVVGPHEVKLHFVAVSRFQKTVVERA
ncbi:hypothetical protein, partial [Klebsiella pneumoniae]|uniref:hypothetical protein n=1 Tax=Klebsiella pneumoniae TaxID=573 RepID=UPI00272F3D4E